MHRRARSTANQRHTLRGLRATNVHISSSSSTSHRFFCAFLRRRRGRRGGGACAFFGQAGHRHARNARDPHNAALRVALSQEPVHLRAAGGTRHGRGHEPRLVPTSRATVAGIAVARPVPLQVNTSALGANSGRIYHLPKYGNPPKLDHRQKCRYFLSIVLFLIRGITQFEF